MLGQYDNGKVYDVNEDSIEDIVEYMVESNKPAPNQFEEGERYEKDYLTYLIDDLKFLRGLYISREDD